MKPLRHDDHAVVHRSSPSVRRSPRGAASAVTLIELMVVISIVTILIAAATIASFSAIHHAAEQQTRILLAAAEAIADQYEAQTGMLIPGAAAPPHPNNIPIEQFVKNAKQLGTTSKMLSVLGKDLMDDTDGDNDDELLDGRGRPIRYVLSNPQSAVPFFQSAGKDDKWDDDDLIAANDDDLYSYEDLE